MTPFLTPVRITLLVALAAALVAGFVLVPAGTLLPIHWNVAGMPDRFAPRELALLLPVGIVLGIWVVFRLLARFGRPAELAAGRHVADAAITLVIGLALVIEIVTVLVGLGQPVSMPQVLAIAFAVLLVVLGNAMPKSQPNGFAGIRIPSTLNDAANWNATHRLGGWLSIAGGLVLLVAAFLAPAGHLVYWLLACLLLPMLAAIVFSLALARRRRT